MKAIQDYILEFHSKRNFIEELSMDTTLSGFNDWLQHNGIDYFKLTGRKYSEWYKIFGTGDCYVHTGKDGGKTITSYTVCPEGERFRFHVVYLDGMLERAFLQRELDDGDGYKTDWNYDYKGTLAEMNRYYRNK